MIGSSSYPPAPGDEASSDSRARRRAPPEQVRNITYQTLDVTRESDFEALQSSEPGVSHLAVYRGGTIISGNMLISIDHNRFDVVVMNIAIMDVEPLDPLATALPQLLKRGRV